MTVEGIVLNAGERTMVERVDSTSLNHLVLEFQRQSLRATEWKCDDGRWSSFGWTETRNNRKFLLTQQAQLAIRVTFWDKTARVFEVPANGEPFPIEAN